MRQIVRLLPCLLLSLVAACGSSGGGGIPTVVASPTGPALFTVSGDYHFVTALSNAEIVSFGRGTLDPAGSFAGNVSRNDLGVVDPAPSAFDVPYGIQPDGRLSLPLGDGCMSTDGTFASVWSPVAGLSAILRRDGTNDASSLTGSYRFVTLITSPVSGDVSSAGGTLVFDGIDGVTINTEFVNEESVLGPGGTSIGTTYTVSPDGDVELDSGSLNLTGGVGRGGELLILGGGSENGQLPFVIYAVRHVTGGSEALLEGDYYLMLHDLMPATHDPLGFVATLQADGLGAATWSPLYWPSFGTPFGTVPQIYTIGAEGQLDMGIYLSAYRGAVSAAGDVALLVGGVVDGDDPSLAVLIRKKDVPESDDLLLTTSQSASIPESVPPFPVGSFPNFDTVFLERKLVLGESPPRLLGLGNEGRRGTLRFELSGLRPGATIARAVLVTRQDSVVEDPFTKLGSVQVDHVDFGRFSGFDDFDPPRRPCGTIGKLSTDPTPGERSLDVTAAVLADIADGRETSDFLLYFPITENGDAVLDTVTFDDHSGPGSRAGPRTRLVISYR